MRICFITTEFPPTRLGGVGTYSLIMPRLLKAAGHDVVIVTKLADDAPREDTWEDIPVYRLPHLWEQYGETDYNGDITLFYAEMHHLRSFVGGFAREVARFLPGLHERYHFDVVLSQEVEGPTYFAQDRQMLFDELGDLPFVLFIHSPHRSIQLNNDDALYNRFDYHRVMYEEHAVSLASGLIYASDYMHRELVGQLGCDNRPNAVVPLPLGDVPDLPREPLPEGEQRLVYAGRIEPRKGVETLVRAVAPLLEKHPRLTLHLFGRDTEHPSLGRSMQEWLQRFVPAEHAERVVFHGAVPREELWREYRQATLGVVPSHWEPFSFVCQEMMASGLPVVATTAGGMAEMIEHGESGWLCEAASPAALTRALQEALGQRAEKLAAVGEAARQRIHQYCDNATITEQTVAALQQATVYHELQRRTHQRVRVPSRYPFSDRPLREAHSAPSVDPSPIQRLAVVIPCYNMGPYLEECVQSLLDQTRPPERIYLVDDGSTDAHSREVYARLEQEHAAVMLQRFVNGGLPTARERGAALAIGDGADALVFIDGDDYLDPTYFAKALDVLNRHPEVGAVTAWTHTVGLMHTYWAPFHNQFPFLLAECQSTPPAMIRREAYEAAGGFQAAQKYAFEDWDFWIGLNGTGFAQLVIPEPLIFYRMREGSISRRYNSATREHGRRFITARHEPLFQRYAREVALLNEALRWWEGDKSAASQEELDTLRRDLEWNYRQHFHFKELHEKKFQEAEWLHNVKRDLEARIAELERRLNEAAAPETKG
ncbi:MAG: glycosyl transferase family protein [Puniceicoccaceae bacterium 5H]|nr:MAG: glycosyl transferase family protein [Puniceicoccaceae bacterium 5H]